MSVQITTAFQKRYADQFALKFQQMQSAMRGTVRVEDQDAEVKFWDYIGEVEPVTDLGRHADTPQIDTPHSRRACKLHSVEWGDLIDDDDKIKSIADPSSAYMRVGVAALNRGLDERILAALGGTVLTGKEGDTTVNFYDTGESRIIAGDGSLTAAGSDGAGTTETGLTLAKIAQAKLYLDEANVPAEGRTFVANYANGAYLLGSAKATSSDYAGIKALVRGEVNTYMGFNFVWLPGQRFATHAVDTGCYECFAYHRDAVLLAMGKDITTRIDERKDKRYSVQVYAKVLAGAVRLQGPGVVKLLLDKDPAMDFTQS